MHGARARSGAAEDLPDAEPAAVAATDDELAAAGRGPPLRVRHGITGFVPGAVTGLVPGAVTGYVAVPGSGRVP